jgi:hypothetical protein
VLFNLETLQFLRQTIKFLSLKISGGKITYVFREDVGTELSGKSRDCDVRPIAWVLLSALPLTISVMLAKSPNNSASQFLIHKMRLD